MSPSDADAHDQEMMTTYRSNVSSIMYAAVHSWGVAVAVALGIDSYRGALFLPKNTR